MVVVAAAGVVVVADVECWNGVGANSGAARGSGSGSTEAEVVVVVDLLPLLLVQQQRHGGGGGSWRLSVLAQPALFSLRACRIFRGKSVGVGVGADRWKERYF